MKICVFVFKSNIWGYWYVLAAKDALDCFKTIPDICCFSVLTILQGQTMNNWIYFGHEFEKSNKLDMN